MRSVSVPPGSWHATGCTKALVLSPGVRSCRAPGDQCWAAQEQRSSSCLGDFPQCKERSMFFPQLSTSQGTRSSPVSCGGDPSPPQSP